MITIHEKKCKSTQLSLIEYCNDIKQFEEIVFSTDEQTLGIGRGNNSWHHFPHSFACSFTLKPNPVITLTSLELGVLVSYFLKQKFNLTTQLKWPNDIFLTNKKLGGIIIKNNSEFLICGVGLNFGSNSKQVFDYSSINENFDQSIYSDFYEFILSNRLTSQQVIEKWTENCVHLNKKVSIDNSYEGIFKGVGENGQALIETQNELKEEYSATLRFS